MQNPFGSEQIPGSYVNLKERIFKKVKSTHVDDQVKSLLQKAYEDALAQENVVLSRPERKRLFSQIIEMIFNDLNRGRGE